MGSIPAMLRRRLPALLIISISKNAVFFPFLISGWIYGFIVWLMAHPYTSKPRNVTRRIDYFILNRIVVIGHGPTPKILFRLRLEKDNF